MEGRNRSPVSTKKSSRYFGFILLSLLMALPSGCFSMYSVSLTPSTPFNQPWDGICGNSRCLWNAPCTPPTTQVTVVSDCNVILLGGSYSDMDLSIEFAETSIFRVDGLASNINIDIHYQKNLKIDGLDSALNSSTMRLTSNPSLPVPPTLEISNLGMLNSQIIMEPHSDNIHLTGISSDAYSSVSMSSPSDLTYLLVEDSFVSFQPIPSMLRIPPEPTIVVSNSTVLGSPSLTLFVGDNLNLTVEAESIIQGTPVNPKYLTAQNSQFIDCRAEFSNFTISSVRFNLSSPDSYLYINRSDSQYGIAQDLQVFVNSGIASFKPFRIGGLDASSSISTNMMWLANDISIDYLNVTHFIGSSAQQGIPILSTSQSSK